MDTSKDQGQFNKIREIEILLNECDTSFLYYCGRILHLKECVTRLEEEKIKIMYEGVVGKLEEGYKSENDERMCW